MKHSKIIECKKTHAVTWKDKDDMWCKLTTELNSQNKGPPRTMKSLKTKYDSFKKELRKTAARQKLELFKTGGGSSYKDIIYTPNEENILGIISLSVEVDVMMIMIKVSAFLITIIFYNTFFALFV
ncbi:hypothetical protein NQ314_011192 [Rhamnusium bicolor]|uniref:Regulatory protein zeste n=1 Tax=Rhamnusium bicolor TaxID=1586634 RepID=A0AAV8X4W2_9CUCU|nr:hypothetical protein NQ314_014293 [Rhamnusium bicolor]KAJ8939255.1 hypothetical protein NQ314_011192 [Rhamnusium bicolor]